MFALRRDRRSLVRMFGYPQVVRFLAAEDINRSRRVSVRVSSLGASRRRPGSRPVALEVEEIDHHRQAAFSVASGIGVQ
jgi:hypothetical protein